jgi:hypothetical protein
MMVKMDKAERKKRGLTMLLNETPSLNVNLLYILSISREINANIVVADISEIIEDNPGISRLSLIDVWKLKLANKLKF